MRRKSILIDIPVIAYQTWCISWMYPDEDEFADNMDSAFDDIKKRYPYDETNKHIKQIQWKKFKKYPDESLVS